MKKTMRTVLVIVIIIAVLVGSLFVLAAIENNINSKLSVTFKTHSNGIEAPASIVVKVGKPYGALPEITRPNYYFGGWWTSLAADAEEITSDTIVKREHLSSLSDYITLHAKWLTFGEKIWKDSRQDIKCFEVEYENPENGNGIVFYDNQQVGDFYFAIGNTQIWVLDEDCYIIDSTGTRHYQHASGYRTIVEYMHNSLRQSICGINAWNVDISGETYTIRNDAYFSKLVLTMHDDRISSLTFYATELTPSDLKPQNITIPNYEVTIHFKRTTDHHRSIPPLPD